MQEPGQADVAKGNAGLRTATGALLCFAVLLSGPARLPGPLAATYSHTVRFSESDLAFARVKEFDLISLAGSRWLNQPGMPRLPLVPVRIALPAGSEITGFAVVDDAAAELPGRFLVWPSQPPQPISSPTAPAFVGPSESVYESAEIFPRSPADMAGWGNLDGVPVCDVLVHPVRYVPADGRLVFSREITFEIHYETARAGLTPRPERPNDAVARLAANAAGPPKSTHTQVYDSSVRPLGGGEVSYLIVTNEAMKGSFQALRDWKARKGIPAEIVTVETILGSYPGVDLQEKIRNCIRYFRNECATQWVLLAGDTQIIPDRKVYVPLSDKPYVPSDLYYSDLDGSWNDDGDLYWGEMPSDNVDLYADVYVGRAPVATETEAQTFVEKVLVYEGSGGVPTEYVLEMLFMGEVLWGDPDNPSDPEYTDAGKAKDLIDIDYVPGRFDITKLYESEGTLGRTPAISEINEGKNLINICCHGFYKSISVASDFLYNDDFLALTNGPKYAVMYSTACLAGGFDQNDCAGEAWVLSERGGGFYLGNSRYGWGTPGYPGEGPSDLYDQAFFESVFQTGFTNLGKAHADAKHEYVAESRTDVYMRYLMFALNLLGDPETRLWTEEPSALAVVHPDTVIAAPQMFTVGVAEGGSAAMDATVCLSKGDEVYAVATTDQWGNASLLISPSTAGVLLVTVTMPDCVPYVGSAVVASGTPPPARPEALVAREEVGPSVRLTWSQITEDGVDSYVIHRNTVPVPDSLSTVSYPETCYVDHQVVAGTTYYYWVSCIDILGLESDVSNIAWVLVKGDVSVPPGRHLDQRDIVLEPNPFESSLRLTVVGSPDAPRRVAIYDVGGRWISDLVPAEDGRNRWTAAWDGRDARGMEAPPGIYFVKVSSTRGSSVMKVVRLG